MGQTEKEAVSEAHAGRANRVEGYGFRVQGLGFRAEGSVLGVEGSGFRV